MKRAVLTLFCLLAAAAQAQNFTWMRGSNLSSPPGNYGTMGVPSGANDPRGRHGCATWVDNAGNLWLFGGEGVFTGDWLNDLWRYNPNTNEWTWIRGSNSTNAVGVYGTQGVPSPLNEPGAREFCTSWTDASGNFWLFGGDGFASTSTFGRLGDLWMYNPATNEWTWMKGFNTIDQNGVYGTQGVPAPANMPGARYGAAKWTDANGDLWLYGGRGFPAAGANESYLNDLWRYNPGNNEWTWMKGTDLIDQAGNYGTIAVTTTLNAPGGREFAATWTSPSGSFYMLGGLGAATSTNASFLNDLWRYDPAGNTWTWIKGANIGNQTGVYGTPGVPSVSNTPGGLFSAASWTDPSGNLWLFGGRGYSSLSLTNLNALMKYDPLTDAWTFIKGTGAPMPPGPTGVYGTQGVAAQANVPGGRYYNSWWTDNNNDFWLLGGLGLSSQSTVSNMNDLWKFVSPCSPDSILAGGSTMLCSSNSVTLTAYTQLPSNIMWYTSPTSPTPVGNGSVFVTAPLTALSSQSVYTFYAEANTCTTSPRSAISISVNPNPTVAVTGPTAACINSSVTLVASGAASYTWNVAPGNSATVSAQVVNNFNAVVLAVDANGCDGSATFTLQANPLPLVTVQNNAPHPFCSGTQATLSAAGAVSYSWSSGQTSGSIVISPSQNTTYTVTGSDANCSASAQITQTVSICQGLAADFQTSTFKLYPNPSQGNFRVELAGDETVLLVMTNLLGQVVHTQSLVKGLGEVTVAGLAPGVYQVKLSGKAIGYQTMKVVLE